MSTNQAWDAGMHRHPRFAESRDQAKSRILKTLAHPTRLFIVEELARGERCVCELTDMIGVEMPTVSRHLGVLKSVGILLDENRGSQVFYRLRVPCVLDFFKCVRAVPGVAGARRFVSHILQREHRGRPLRMVVQGLSWPEDQGEWVSLIGGELVMVADQARVDLRKFRRRHLGCVFQKANLIPFLSAVENVQVALEINDAAPRAAHKRALELLDYLGVADRAGYLPDALCGGQPQRIAALPFAPETRGHGLIEDGSSPPETSRG